MVVGKLKTSGDVTRQAKIQTYQNRLKFQAVFSNVVPSKSIHTH
jgi:hypothetical protein